MNKNMGAEATMMVMMLLIATVVESAASPTEKAMIELVTDHHAASSFPRKMMRNGKGNGVCPIRGWPCIPAFGCGPLSGVCACYTSGYCGDYVG
ncbi:hypothetical protein E5676_scaffold655G00610 [Cucumis melo var. makuwa]|nr:hypothetical protein E6C27_scaffold46G00610 [Cucumis melo var. makuwa]TYK29465.1 hypothetical protein E5676_scaffold655G00610 [Cucumis melo var. makuwa]